MKICVDLCSGFGGGSEAFMRDPKWLVKRYDNNPLLSGFPNTSIVDIAELSGDLIGPAELVWFSPTCLEFSTAYSAPRMIAARRGEKFTPCMDLLKTGLQVIEEINPRYFVVENVFGAIPDFEPYLGKPRQLISSFALWGNFPFLNIPRDFKHSKADGDPHSSNPLRMNHRSLVPMEISTALKQAIENQQTLQDWS